MFHQNNSILGNGDLIANVNSESGIMAFDWYITDDVGDIITTPVGISLLFYRRLLNAVVKDNEGVVTSELWEDFASNPFDAEQTSIPDTYISTDQIKCNVSGMDNTFTFHLNTHQRV